MHRRTLILLQAGGAGNSDSPFGRTLGGDAAREKSGAIPGIGYTPGGPYARFPEYAARMLREEEVRLKKAKAIGEGKDPNEVGRDKDQVVDKLSQEEISHRFVARTSKPKNKDGSEQQSEDEQGPGERDDVPDAVARKMRQGQKYSTGPDKVATWYKIFGSSQAIPPNYSSHPDFKIGWKDAPDHDQSPEAEEMRRRTGIMYFRKSAEAQSKREEEREGKSSQKKDPEQQEEEEQQQCEQQQQHPRRIDDEQMTVDDPFTAAFTPNATAAAKRREQLLREKRQQEEDLKRRGEYQNGSNNEDPSSPSSQAKSESTKTDQKDGGTTGREKTTTTENTNMGSGGYNFTRNQVGGASVTEWREKIKRVRARGDGNLVVRLQGEIGYAHILAQTGLVDDANECLEVGEYVWKKLAELKHASPQSEGSTHGVVINVSSSMYRAAKTANRGEVATLWQERLSNSDKAMRDNMEFVNKNQMSPQTMEPTKTSGPRKHLVSANAMWARLRNPWFGVKWARKTLGEDPEEGPRYTK